MPIQQFYDPNYHRLNQSQHSSNSYMLDQTGGGGGGSSYVDAYMAGLVATRSGGGGSGWAPSGPTSLIADGYSSFNTDHSTTYFQPRCIPKQFFFCFSLSLCWSSAHLHNYHHLALSHTRKHASKLKLFKMTSS